MEENPDEEERVKRQVDVKNFGMRETGEVEDFRFFCVLLHFCISPFLFAQTKPTCLLFFFFDFISIIVFKLDFFMAIGYSIFLFFLVT